MPENTTQKTRFDTLGLKFDCICIEIGEDVRTDVFATAKNVVSKVLGQDWQVLETDDSHEFDVECSSFNLPYKHAWELCHKLVATAEVVFARPEFELDEIPLEAVSLEGRQVGYDALSLSQVGRDPVKGSTKNEDWPLVQCNIKKAWDLFEDKGLTPGNEILIGHPDTGYRTHNELDEDRIVLQHDFVGGDTNAISDDANHGLGTASVIVSGKSGRIQGPALGSNIAPLRVIKNSVVLWRSANFRRLRRALVYCEDKNVDVISISLGGAYPCVRGRVRKRLKKLCRKGTIVVAAAGNIVSINFGLFKVKRNGVTFPGRWPETIAVAANTVDRTTWSGSCRGDAVDISAPGDSVWRAIYKDDDPDPESAVVRHSGTSFATALVAGSAALWKSYRRDELAKVKAAQIYPIFRRLIAQTAQPAPELMNKTGAGILDTHALLKADISSAGSGDSPDTTKEFPLISETFGEDLRTMSMQFGSVVPLVGMNFDSLNETEADELVSAIDYEIWYLALTKNPSSDSIIEELSASLRSKLDAIGTGTSTYH